MFEKEVHYVYSFRFDDGETVDFELRVDSQNRNLKNSLQLPQEFARFARFDRYCCDNCQNSRKSDEIYCPVASNLFAVTLPFKSHRSYDDVVTEVQASQRSYYKRSSLQQGLQSLFGLVMATSDCAHLRFLSPMALFHLPFADENETMLRVLGLYLLEQHLSAPELPIDLEGLSERYKRVEKVNKAIAERIAAIEQEDAARNALVILDTFIKMFSLEYELGLDKLRSLFSELSP